MESQAKEVVMPLCGINERSEFNLWLEANLIKVPSPQSQTTPQEPEQSFTPPRQFLMKELVSASFQHLLAALATLPRARKEMKSVRNSRASRIKGEAKMRRKAKKVTTKTSHGTDNI